MSGAEKRVALRVGRKRPICFVVGPQRLGQLESLRSSASHLGLFRPIAGSLVIWRGSYDPEIYLCNCP